MEELLQLAKKVSEEAEVYEVSRKETSARFEANRLKQVQTREARGRALRLIKNGRIGFSAATGSNGSRELVDRALEMAPFGAQAKFNFPGPQALPAVEVYDPAIEKVSEDDMVHLGQSLIDGVRKHTPEILCEGGVTRVVLTVKIANTKGETATYKKSVFGFGVEGVLIRGTDMLFVGDGDSSCSPISDFNKVLEKTIRQLEQGKKVSPSVSGSLPVIFTPDGVASALLVPLVMAINGKTVLQGASPLANRKGERVFDARFSVVDDPTIRLRPGSRMCDDEGVPSRKTSVVENGVVTAFLYDLQTAALAGVNSTGNGARTLGTLPSPSHSAIIVQAGDVTLKNMVADMKEGLIVEQLIGASQGNVLGGDFSGNVLLGYRVKNGEIAGRVKDTMVSGNIYKAMEHVEAIGSEAEWVGDSIRTPHICCSNIAVSTKN